MTSSKTPIITVTKADCTRQTFRCGGNGGQNVNKRETGVRFIHEPSGARGQACDERLQGLNERLAWERLARSKEMQGWLRLETARRLGQRVPETLEQIQARVDRQIEQDFRDGQVVVEEDFASPGTEQ